ncbi:NADPH-dependent F420 reductase [Kineosporia sp. J2-2]|uniref:NADPH-dependent F420 reductase n=1 Tax=Kineosporia corallincola TaxID=2835133 RepID=A0ABS5TG60_9ACTN|nr:NADPH-dependent F420 reductase [Kineosporia corallincola]MBT0770035.1 NADPH-dependent F420 reductase [Kineosporia corallincola]
MTTIGFIGTGKIGATVARMAVTAGHDVVLSNRRGPQSLHELAGDLGPRAVAATPEQAARAGEIVVLAVPLEAYRQIPAGPLRGKVVIDTANYKPAEHPGRLPDADSGVTTPHELMQHHLPGSFVVKALANMFFRHLPDLARPAGAPDRSTLPIAGDDPDAKAAVSALLDSLGYDTLDAGPLAESRRFATFGTPANQAYLDPEGMFAVPGHPAPATRIAELLRSVP